MYAAQTIMLCTDDLNTPVVRVAYHKCGLILHGGSITGNVFNIISTRILFFRDHPELTSCFDVMTGFNQSEVESLVLGYDENEHVGLYPVKMEAC